MAGERSSSGSSIGRIAGARLDLVAEGLAEIHGDPMRLLDGELLRGQWDGCRGRGLLRRAAHFRWRRHHRSLQQDQPHPPTGVRLPAQGRRYVLPAQHLANRHQREWHFRRLHRDPCRRQRHGLRLRRLGSRSCGFVDVCVVIREPDAASGSLVAFAALVAAARRWGRLRKPVTGPSVGSRAQPGVVITINGAARTDHRRRR